MSTLALSPELGTNRTEELGQDVWKSFVMPLFLDQIDLLTATKPRVVVGGRGCGKTMLLRYFSYGTQFSKERGQIASSELLNIGVYWRADTQFANALSGRTIADDIWQSAFNHSFAISVGIEIIKSVQFISKNAPYLISPKNLGKLEFEELSAFSKLLGGSIRNIVASLRRMDWEFQSWINNARSDLHPHFLPGREFIKALIYILREALPEIKDTKFAIFIDEYENLRREQQRIINTYIKHSESPLVFHLAIKRNGMQTKETLGAESIIDKADYRAIDLDDLLQQNNFDVYAAEILSLRLNQIDSSLISIDGGALNDRLSLVKRRSEEYQNAILGKVRQFFPSLGKEELASTVFDEPALYEQLKRAIAQALKRKASSLKAEQFIRSEFKQASIIVPALLHRSSISPEVVLGELRQLQLGKENSFTGPTNWIHNNFEGCLLFLYEPFNRICPFYAGFDTLVKISHANLRHLLEITYKAIQRVAVKGLESTLVVPPKEQAEAARQASSAFVAEVKGFGRLGNRLHSFVLTLGSLFALSQRRPSQSEPEINHFSIAKGEEPLSDDDNEFLNEAIKWSVLIETQQTKIKSDFLLSASDLVLNPIYSPYFHITYRKRRKIDLRSEDVIVLIRGNYEQRKALLKRYVDRWEVDTKDSQQYLFSHLEGK